MKKLLVLTALLLSAQQAYAINDCRDLKSGEKNELKTAACQAIAKMHERSLKVDVNRCVVKATFNICENMDFGATSTNLQVDGVPDSFGRPFVCDMYVTTKGEIIQLDCNGNY